MISGKKLFDTVRQKQFFRKFLFSYMMILGISTILTMVIYLRFCSVIEDTAIQGYENMLQQSAEMLEQDFEEVETLYYNFLHNSQITKVINSPTVFERENFREIKEVFDSMPPAATKTTEPTIYLIIPRQNVVISSVSTFHYPVFYSYMIDHNDISPELWDSIVNERHYGYMIGGRYEDEQFQNASNLYRVSSMPIVSKTPNAIMLTVIKKQRLDEAFQWFEEENCSVMLMDENNTVLYTSSPFSIAFPQDMGYEADVKHREVSQDGEKYLCAYMTINNVKLKLAVVTPLEDILAPARQIQRQMIGLFVFFLLLGLALTVLFSLQNSSPLDEIFSLIESNFSEYRLEGVNGLHAAISNLIANDDRATRIVEKNLPYIQSEQRKRLLMGELILHSGEIPVMLEDISGRSYNVLAIEIIGAPGADSLRSLLEFSVVKDTIRSCERKYGALRGYYVDFSNNICAMIIACDEVSATINAQRLEEYAGEIFSQLSSDGNVFLKFAAGSFQPNLSDVYYSFITARELLDNGILEPNRAVIWETPQGQEYSYYFSLQIEQRLISTVYTGNHEEAGKLLQMIYSQNFEDHQIPERMITRLYDELNGVLYKLLAQMHETILDKDIFQVTQNIKEIKKHQNILPPEQMFQAYQDTFLFLCYCVKPKQKSKSGTMRPQLAEYMQQNYADPSFGLSALADHFNFSEIYMSQLFKENMGTTFSEYLERLRIDAACSLLRETSLTIADISQKAGYYSPHAFRRAFKRVTGVLPTDYRSLT